MSRENTGVELHGKQMPYQCINGMKRELEISHRNSK